MAKHWNQMTKDRSKAKTGCQVSLTAKPQGVTVVASAAIQAREMSVSNGKENRKMS